MSNRKSIREGGVSDLRKPGNFKGEILIVHFRYFRWNGKEWVSLD